MIYVSRFSRVVNVAKRKVKKHMKLTSLVVKDAFLKKLKSISDMKLHSQNLGFTSAPRKQLRIYQMKMKKKRPDDIKQQRG